MDADGYCFQHFVANTERVKREEREAIVRAEREAAIVTYLAWVAEHPSIHDTMDGRRMVTQQQSTRGLAGITPESLAEALAAGGGLEPPTSRVTTDRSTTELPRKGPHHVAVRKGPHRLTELA